MTGLRMQEVEGLVIGRKRVRKQIAIWRKEGFKDGQIVKELIRLGCGRNIAGWLMRKPR